MVKVLEEHKLPWAIVTNGKDWRLYCAQAHSRATNYYEIDLPGKLEYDDLIAFRYFHLFFRAEAFVAAAGKPCFLDQLRDGSAAFAKELGDKLRQHIFDKVFPYLAQGFVEYRKHKLNEKTSAGDEFLAQTYDATLTLLYRLLFLLYAESLDLLPVHEPAYAQVSLTRLKNEIAEHAGPDSDTVEGRLKARYTQSDTGLYDRLAGLVAIIDAGSKDHNVPTYNGGLFATSPDKSDPTREARAARFLHKYKVPDFFLARALDLLARGEDSKSSELVFVDYKSLGVRQLGSVYEGLLMYHVIIPSDDWEKKFQRPGLRVALVPSNKDRKSTGSFFTPPHIVKYIVTNTVGPLLDEKFAALEPKLRAAQREYHDQKKYEASRNLPPILRTGEEMVFKRHADIVHELFDIKVLDMAVGSGHFVVETVDYITDRVLEFLAGFPWNPVQVFIDRRVRGPIIDSLEAQGIKINEDRLTDVNLIKRLVMKRCVYGVDINPMAVELAKVSVWLDSFTIGAPLSFMDHHFRCGNSLIGSSIEELKKLAAQKGGLWSIPMEPLERATKNMETIADLSDVTLTEVHKSAETYQKVLAGVKGYRVLLDCMTAEHFGVEGAANLVTEGADLDLEHWDKTAPTLPAKEKRWVNEATRISAERRFFHWDIDFPDVFFTTRRPPKRRKFDAAVGNPPWGGLRTLGEYDQHLVAKLRSARKGTDWFAMFVEMEMAVVHDHGSCGVVLPSGWQTADESQIFRRSVEDACVLASFVNLPYDTFEDANVDSCIAVFRRGVFGSRPARVLTYDVHEIVDRIDESDPRWETINTHMWHDIDSSSHQWLTMMQASELAVTNKIKQSSRKLGDVANEIQRGISPFEPQSRERGPKHEKCLDGELRRYTYEYSGRCCTSYHSGIDEYKPPSLFTGPRTILRQLISRQFRTQAVSVDEPFVVNQSHQVIHPGAGLSHHHITGIINSAITSFWHVRRSALARRDDFPKIVLEDTKAFPIPERLVEDKVSRREFHDAVQKMCVSDVERRSFVDGMHISFARLVEAADVASWTGATALYDPDYLGWSTRYPLWVPDEATLADGRWYPNGVAPPLDGIGPGDIPWDLIARVYPSYPLPRIDESAWETAAWEDFCDLLRKNKTKIGNVRIRADLTGLGAVANPTGPMKKLQETFLKYHREIRENRAKAAELDFLIDRIVFKLFDLTLDEQKLILSRVGPGRPLPPRRGRKAKTEPKADNGPGLFST